MDKTISDVADMLKEASEKLRKAAQDQSAQPNRGNSDSCESTGTSTTTRSRDRQVGTSQTDEESRNTLRETLLRARNMITGSSSTGGNRRLNRRERLRSAAPYDEKQHGKGTKTNKPAKKKQTKPIEYALLKCYDDDDDNVEDDEVEHTLKWDSVIANGIIMAEEDDNEANIRKKLKDSLVNKFEVIGENDFQFVKVRQKKITVLDLGPNTEYGYAVVKKMAGQGMLYIKIKQGYDFVYSCKSSSDDFIIDDPTYNHSSSDGVPTTPQPATYATTSTTVQPAAFTPSTVQQKNDSPSANQVCIDLTSIAHQARDAPVHPTSPLPVTASASSDPRSVNQVVIQQIISEGYQNALHDPVQILSVLQKELLHGRKLDLTDDQSTCEGKTNYICVNRQDILKTTFNELECVTDFCITFEVDFMGEMASDLGGLRKEWIRHVNRAIKEKYFDHRLLDFCPNDYFFVGLMMGIALLQNGQLPKFLPEDIITQLVLPSNDPCIEQLQNGLQIFGFVQFFQAFPCLLQLLQPREENLTPKMLLNLLTPMFSPEGSTAISKEKELYSIFVHYVRQVASGRRNPVTLNSILEFATCASEEPVLGFAKHPSITFSSGEQVKN
jgi:hypothetical protein